MSINIGSMLGFAVCGWLGEKVGWHIGFGAAGVGMLFGVTQFILFRHHLGEAGKYPNKIKEETRRNYLRGLGLVVFLVAAVVVTGMAGFWVIDPVYFAERFRDFLVIISIIYFIYLLFFAGLSADEKKNVLMLLLLFIGAAAFWSGFDQSAGSLTIFYQRLCKLNFWLFYSAC